MPKSVTNPSPAFAEKTPSIAVKADFMLGGGEMGTLMRELDWSTTPLGALDQWPQSLRTTVSILLNSRFPMFLFWGPEATCLYNDGYRPSLGAHKHPQALGQRGRECWDDIWHIIGPQIATVMTLGEPTWYEDQLVPFDRNGYFEEIYFTYSYSPVRDEAGVGGTLVVCTETTKHVIGERRLRILRELATKAASVSRVSDAYLHSLEILRHSTQDIPFALLYQLDDDGRQAHLVGAANLPVDQAAYLPSLQLQETEANPLVASWPLQAALQTSQSLFVADLSSRFGLLPGGAWPEPTHSALIVPITPSGQSQPTGFLVAGISPRKAFDDDYRGFLELATGYVGTALSNARAYEAERCRAEELAELDRAKTTFFSNISHEFRTPLTLMLGPAEDALADQAQPLPARQQERVAVIYRNALRLLKLVNTLLDFSRLEAGRMQALYEPIDLAAFTTELASVFRSAIERVRLRLVLDCPPLPELVYVDQEMWEKIVLNLLSNALKFTFAGEIVVTLRAITNHIELEIRDTGVGIPAEQLPHLFERFHRVQGATGRTHEGSGIGLALVQELAQLHGGSVRVSSIVGQGTAFVVTIPLGKTHLPVDQISTTSTRQRIVADALPYVEEALRWLPTTNGDDKPSRVEQLVAPPSAPPFSDPSLTHPKRILLADDNLDLREYVTRLLAPFYTVEPVADGQAALAAALARPPDLVLTDVMMPRLDGFALLHALRAEPRTRTVPIIMLSARAGEEASLEGMEGGADDYLSKPFSARELLTRVRAHLNLRQIRQETEEQLKHFNEMLEKGIAQRTQELVQRNQELDRFAYVASHDLKSPLRAIDHLANWIAEDAKAVLPATSQDHLRKMRGRIRRMEKLLDDLLVYSRSARHQYPAELVDTAKLVQDIVNLLAIPEDFLITTEAPLPVLVTARVPLEVVLRNLLANAIKHHERADGKVLIAAQDQGDKIEFTVQDDGPGIAEKFHARIFEIFQTLKPRDVMEGSGMGLAIVKKIVESRGGKIYVDSVEGQGATFHFTWPKDEVRVNPQESAE